MCLANPRLSVDDTTHVSVDAKRESYMVTDAVTHLSRNVSIVEYDNVDIDDSHSVCTFCYYCSCYVYVFSSVIMWLRK